MKIYQEGCCRKILKGQIVFKLEKLRRCSEITESFEVETMEGDIIKGEKPTLKV